MVVQNMTPDPIYVSRGMALAQLTEAELMPKPEVKPDTIQKLEELDEREGITPSMLMCPERVEKLKTLLCLGSLEGSDPAEYNNVITLFEEYQDIFALEPGEVGCCDLDTHKIQLLKNKPYKEHYQPIGPQLKEEVRGHIKQMLEAGAIRPSKSPWSNAVVLVRKKDGGLRFCIDFRRLNAIMQKDLFPLPRIQEVIVSCRSSDLFFY